MKEHVNMVTAETLVAAYRPLYKRCWSQKMCRGILSLCK